MKKAKILCLSVVASIVLSACGSMNSIDAQGGIKNQEVKWGNIEKTTFKTNGDQPGMWKSKADLALLQPGMNKSQLYELMGRPHYNEGLFGVHEWNYVVNKNTPQGVQHCQLKVTFDKKMNAQQFLWKPAGCMEEAPAPQVVEAPVRKFSLRSDFLFDFDKATLKPEANIELNRILSEINRKPINQVIVVGHTDRLGADDYNQKLSEKRAVTVSNFLVSKGVPSSLISAYGAGESKPVKECDGTKPTASLKECLAENRRVEISIK